MDEDGTDGNPSDSGVLNRNLYKSKLDSYLISSFDMKSRIDPDRKHGFRHLDLKLVERHRKHCPAISSRYARIFDRLNW